jgi:hypothetical protein
VTNLDSTFTLTLTVGRIPSMGDVFSKFRFIFCRVYFSFLTSSVCMLDLLSSGLRFMSFTCILFVFQNAHNDFVKLNF